MSWSWRSIPTPARAATKALAVQSFLPTSGPSANICIFLDSVVVFDAPDVRPLIRALKPDIHVKGTDYTPESIPERDEVLAYGGRSRSLEIPKTTAPAAALEALKR